jgi:uncharacterized alkaline shock family protein YloU
VSDPLVVRGRDGTITVPGGVLDRIVRRAAEEADGVKVRRRGVSVKDARVTLSLEVRYGQVLPAVAEDVQRRVAMSLRGMCRLDPAAVDVTVVELT